MNAVITEGAGESHNMQPNNQFHTVATAPSFVAMLHLLHSITNKQQQGRRKLLDFGQAKPVGVQKLINTILLCEACSF